MKDVEVHLLQTVEPKLSADGRAHDYTVPLGEFLHLSIDRRGRLALLLCVLMSFVIDMFKIVPGVFVLLHVVDHGAGCDEVV